MANRLLTRANAAYGARGVIPARAGKALALAGLVVLCMGALCACSSGEHAIIASDKSCVICHGTNRETYDVGDKATDVVASGGQVVVNTSADVVYVCTPKFSNEEATHYVPAKRSQVATQGAQTTIDLDEGLWAIAIEQDNNTSKSVLVRVSADSHDTPTIEL